MSMSIYTCVIAQCLYALKNELWIIMVKKVTGFIGCDIPVGFSTKPGYKHPIQRIPSFRVFFVSFCPTTVSTHFGSVYQSEKKYPKEKSSFQEQEILCV